MLLLAFASGCASQPQQLPTLAVIATDTPIAALDAPSTSTTSPLSGRPTLPPTFTPTPPPTAIPPTATATPQPTELSGLTNVLGSPLTSPDSFPVNVQVRGGGYSLTAAPPQAVRLVRMDGFYQFSLAHASTNGRSGSYESLTLRLFFVDGIQPGEYGLDFCAGSGGTPANGAPLCLTVSYVNDGLVATNPASGATMVIESIEPFSATIETSLDDRLLPNTSSSQFNVAAQASLQVVVDGQSLTAR